MTPPVRNPSNYGHISLQDLLRLRLNEASQQSSLLDELQKEVKTAALPNDSHSSVSVIQRLEQQLRAEMQKRETVELKCISLEREREASSRQTEGVDNLRIKVSQMLERLRHEREQRSKVDKILVNEKHKLSVMSDHIEKLMIHLRHEAIAKSRSLKAQSKQQREIDILTENILSANKKNDRKDELISELRNSAQLLEAQLKLMDEKFMELRTKLNFQRNQTEMIIRRKDKELQQQVRVQEESTKGKDSASALNINRRKGGGSEMHPFPREGRNSVANLKKTLSKSIKGKGA